MCAWYLYVYESWHRVGTDTPMPVCADGQACGVHVCTSVSRLEIYIRCLPNNAPLFFGSGSLVEALGQASLSHGFSMSLQEEL